jgi:hypothetical protein
VPLCSQYPERYRFDLDHLKYSLSYKLLSSILSDFGFEFEEDQKIEARKMEKMLDLIRSYTMKVTENHQSLWEQTNDVTFRSNEPMHVSKWNNLLDDEIA